VGHRPGNVVVAATDVVVVDEHAELGVAVERYSVHPVLEDRDHAPTRGSTDRQSPFASGLDALDRVALGIADEGQARPVPLLRVGTVGDDLGDDPPRVGTEFLGPRDQSLRWPGPVLAMRLGSVSLVGDVGTLRSVAAWVAGDSLAIEE